jgi:cyclopropane-fatty-acyl-phospholipid synthase
MNLTDLAYRRWLPDAVARAGMRRVFAKRLRSETKGDADAVAARQARFFDEVAHAQIVVAAERARRELPAEFFKLHLGPHLKYSACLYPTGRESLEGAEQAMLAAYGDRAQLTDGQRILEIGCGWGSFALWAASRYPRASVVALADSEEQRAFVEAEAAARGIANLVVRTGGVLDHAFKAADLGDGFDRAVSIEAIEHVGNFGPLFARIAGWLKDDGRLFVQVVANRHVGYRFEDRAQDGWMTRYSFAGGTMPSFDLFKQFRDDLVVEKRWWVSGRHYEHTARDWLERLDLARDPVLDVLQATYGGDARRWFSRWRRFYMAMTEMFGYDSGAQWGLGHYRFAKAGS